MPAPDPANHYLDLGLDELSQTMMERAGQLLRGDQTGRRDVAYLLIAAAHRVSPDAAKPNSPHRIAGEGRSTALDAFGPLIVSEAKAARWRILGQALDALRIRIDHTIGTWRVEASESDEKAHEALRRMDTMERDDGTTG